MKLFLTTKIWTEGKHYIAYTPELEVASQGKTREEAEKRLREAVGAFLQSVKERGFLAQALKEVGFSRGPKREWWAPSISISAVEVKI